METFSPAHNESVIDFSTSQGGGMSFFSKMWKEVKKVARSPIVKGLASTFMPGAPALLGGGLLGKVAKAASKVKKKTDQLKVFVDKATSAVPTVPGGQSQDTSPTGDLRTRGGATRVRHATDGSP